MTLPYLKLSDRSLCIAMNICHVITRLIIGGAQENTLLTCRGLHERGHKVTFISGPETGPEGSLWKQAEAIGCELIKLDSLRRSVNPLIDGKCLADLGRVFSRIKPDIIHTHSSKAGIIGRFAAARVKIPIIVHTIHGMSFNRTQPLLTQAAYRWLERRAARVTTAIISVADAMTNQALAAGIGVREQYTTIRSGIETDRFAPSSEQRSESRKKWGFTDDHIVIGTVARLFQNKGYEELLEAIPDAVRRAPHLRFVWVGDGRHRQKYLHRLESLGLRDRVHLTGLVLPEQIHALLNGFDVVVHASRWEGLARVLVQAMLTEVPVVSFDNDGAPEVVRNNETGILVPYGDIGGLTNAIVSLARDVNLRRKLGSNGRSLCLNEFDWRRMVDQIAAVYQRLSRDASISTSQE